MNLEEMDLGLPMDKIGEELPLGVVLEDSDILPGEVVEPEEIKTGELLRGEVFEPEEEAIKRAVDQAEIDGKKQLESQEKSKDLADWDHILNPRKLPHATSFSSYTAGTKKGEDTFGGESVKKEAA